MAELTSEMALVLQALRQNPGSTARALTRLLREAGADIRKSQVNSVLYTALGRRLVEKEDGTPPRWLLLETMPKADSTRPVVRAAPPSASTSSRAGVEEGRGESEPAPGGRWRLRTGDLDAIQGDGPHA